MSVVLIGGSSLAGKSTLAEGLANNLGWKVVSTDYLARHPGRPWRTDGTEVPPHVVEHFLSLSPDELLADVLRHYRSLAPRIREIVLAGDEGLVVEGSAVLPELAASLQDEARAIYLVAKNGQLTERIRAHAEAENAAAMKFAQRAELFNDFIVAEVTRLGLPMLDLEGIETGRALDWLGLKS